MEGIDLPEVEPQRDGENMFQAVVISVFLEIERGWKSTLDAK